VFGIILFTIVFVLTYIGVDIFRRWSLKRELLDIPNERSSHQTPTPRGGGIVIVLNVLICYLVLSFLNFIVFEPWFFSASVLIALISWIDDLFTISFVWRFLVHSIAAILMIYNLGYFQDLDIPFFTTVDMNHFGIILTFFWIVWMTNAYNFMDGIDGIAGIQAVIAGLGWYFAGNLIGTPETAIFGLLIAASAVGFLIHNWQPAKIFMGDVGSAFLGFCFAVIPLFKINGTNNFKGLIPIIAVAFVWLFFFDTVFTFFKRLIKKQRVWEAHREHFYQQMVIDGNSHQFVSILYGLLTLLSVCVIFGLIISNLLSVNALFYILLFQSVFLISCVYIKQLSRFKSRNLDSN